MTFRDKQVSLYQREFPSASLMCSCSEVPARHWESEIVSMAITTPPKRALHIFWSKGRSCSRGGRPHLSTTRLPADRSREAPRPLQDRLRPFSRERIRSCGRCRTHPEGSAFGLRRGRELKITRRHEISDLALAPAGERQRRRLDPIDLDHARAAPAFRHRSTGVGLGAQARARCRLAR